MSRARRMRTPIRGRQAGPTQPHQQLRLASSAVIPQPIGAVECFDLVLRPFQRTEPLKPLGALRNTSPLSGRHGPAAGARPRRSDAQPRAACLRQRLACSTADSSQQRARAVTAQPSIERARSGITTSTDLDRGGRAKKTDETASRGLGVGLLSFDVCVLFKCLW